MWSKEGQAYEARLLWAACCLGFFAFLRAGEFTSTATQDTASLLTVADITETPSFLRVFLKRSKIDPFGNGIALYVGRTYHPISPVTAVLSFVARRPHLQGPLFIHEDGSPLTRSHLVKQVRQALSQKGIDVSRYSGHSFRIGAATTAATIAAAVGIPEATIKMLGCWESTANLRYIRTPREQLIPISASLLSGTTR